MLLLSAYPANADEITESEAETLEETDPNVERMPQSKRLVRKQPEKDKKTLYINPDVILGGMLSHYKDLGNFSFLDFGGGLGFTFLEDWHFRAYVLALGENHVHKRQDGSEQEIKVWLVQPTISAMYRIAHIPKWHYFFESDLFIGPKLGINVLSMERKIKKLDSGKKVFYGVSFLMRMYLYERFGIAPNVELGTVDYLANFFLQYGGVIFWDFELIE